MAFLKSHKTTQHFSTIIHTQRGKDRERKRLLQPYQEESTTSRLISEVKPVWAWFGQGLETTWEHQVSSSLFLFLPPFFPLVFLHHSSLLPLPLSLSLSTFPVLLRMMVVEERGTEREEQRMEHSRAVLESANHHTQCM